LHAHIAYLADNRVLTTFVRILSTLWLRRNGEDGAFVVDPAVAESHELIAGALEEGDLLLARHRLERHLKSLDSWCV
jgi:DNA-binding GntR family transcriptional regulator